MDEDGGALRIRSGGEGWSQGTAGASGSIRASTRYILGALSSLRVCVGRVSDRNRAGVSGRHHRHDGLGLWSHRAGADRIGLYGSRVFQPGLPAFLAFDLTATCGARGLDETAASPVTCGWRAFRPPTPLPSPP